MIATSSTPVSRPISAPISHPSNQNSDSISAPPQASAFAAMGLRAPLLRAIAAEGYTTPTPIQSQAIPHVMQGHDLLGCAQTGTGKTAAFAVPIVEKIIREEFRPQALVLAPTRELAVQVAGAIYDIGHNQGVRVLAVYGGQPIDRQLRGLAAGVHVVVGTPGRIMDHIRRGTLKLDHIRTVILDEGDQMLDMGFIEDIEFILSKTPRERQRRRIQFSLSMVVTVLHEMLPSASFARLE